MKRVFMNSKADVSRFGGGEGVLCTHGLRTHGIWRHFSCTMSLMKSLQDLIRFPRYKVYLLSQVRHVYRRKRPLKMFQENENESAHKTMEKLSEYSRTVRSLRSSTHSVVQSADKSLSLLAFNVTDIIQNGQEHLLSPAQLVSKFVEMTNAVQLKPMTLEDPSAQNLVDGLLLSLPDMTDAQIECVLASLCLWPPTQSTRTPNFMALWNNLDSECCRRCPNWSADVQLRVADSWYHLRLSRISQYNSRVIRNLGRDLVSLSSSNFVHLLFLINLQRRVESRVIADAERVLLETFEAISVKELAIVAMGFFKTKNPIRSHLLLRAIVSKVTVNLETIDDSALLPIIKLLRSSLTYGCSQLYVDLQKKCLPFVSKLWTTTVVHLALIGHRQLVCCEELLHKMITRFLDEGLAKIRLKELSKSVFCLALYLHEDSNAADYVRRIAEEMKKPERNEDVSYYPDHFVSLVLYSTYFDVYPLDLISRCFDEQFLSSCNENSSFDVERELYALHCSVQIERPTFEYDGLPLYQRVKIFKEAEKLTNNDNNHGRFLANVSYHLNEVLGGREFYFVGQLLPHYSPKDILVILDKNGNPKPIPREIVGRAPSSIIERNSDDKWLVIVLGGYRKRALGHVSTKLRQLKRLGYSTLEIQWFPYHDWTEDSKRKHLSDLILD